MNIPLSILPTPVPASFIKVKNATNPEYNLPTPDVIYGNAFVANSINASNKGCIT